MNRSQSSHSANNSKNVFVAFSRGLFAPIITILMLIGFALTNITAQALAAEPGDRLIVIYSDNCPWCEAFDEEVGQFYSNTPEGAVFPLEKIDFYSRFPATYSVTAPATFTPTFIVVNDFEEVGRIEGYPGQELFWWRLSEFITPQ